jgi:1-acyl-sn-glycerol-3-phosphate acyltransferase
MKSNKPGAIRMLYQPYKWLVFVPLLCLITIIWGSLSIIFATLFNARIGMKLGGSPWAKLNCLAALVFVKVRNKRNIIPGQSYVVVANHQSLFDILVLAGWLDIDLRWVAKASLKKVPMFGIASVKMEHIFIDRSNPDAALATLEDAKQKIINGTSVMFFPEGTRSADGNLKEFKKGAFRMALDLNIPILPITVKGTRHILPVGTMDLVPGSAEIVIHPQINVTDYSDGPHDSIEDLIQKTRTTIKSALF